MKTQHPNILNMIAVNNALKPLGRDVVFVGGATTLLYADDPSLGEARPTDDVDCVIEVASKIEYHRVEERLREIGFKNSQMPGNPICRWKLGKLIVDIMPTTGDTFGFANRWYEPGFANRIKVKIYGTEETVYIFPAVYFLASKVEALVSRGLKDLLMSQDFQDIAFLIVRRESLLAEVQKSDSNLKDYFREKIPLLINNEQFEQALAGEFPRANEKVLREKVTEVLRKIAS